MGRKGPREKEGVEGESGKKESPLSEHVTIIPVSAKLRQLQPAIFQENGYSYVRTCKLEIYAIKG